jgi:hypothetical protein
MTLIKHLLIVYGVLAFFGPRAVVLAVIGYGILKLSGYLINRALDNDAFNRVGFGAFCSVALMAIIWLIQKG